MPIQKLVFLSCSPSGEQALQEMLKKHVPTLSAEEGAEVIELVSRAVHGSTDDGSIRIWFHLDYSDASPATAFLKTVVETLPVEDFFFARIGLEPKGTEQKGRYERRKLGDIGFDFD